MKWHIDSHQKRDNYAKRLEKWNALHYFLDIVHGAGKHFCTGHNNDIDSSNKVNGKSVRYLEMGFTLSNELDVGQVILV